MSCLDSKGTNSGISTCFRASLTPHPSALLNMQQSTQPRGSRLAFWQRVWPFSLLTAILVITAGTSIYMLSAVRGIVAGESFWSKSQKDAIYYLTRYAEAGNREHLDKYHSAMLVPRGDSDAREALEKNPPDLAAARKGLLQGANHPDDINSLIWLLRNFRHFKLIKEPIYYWKQGDEYLAQLGLLATEVEQGYSESKPPTKETIRTWKREIGLINSGASPAAKAFTDSLGQSSRRIVYILLSINCTLALVLVAVWSLSTHRALRQRQQTQSVLDAEKERAQVTLAALGDAVITTDAHGCPRNAHLYQSGWHRFAGCRSAKPDWPLTQACAAVLLPGFQLQQ
ncbi:MAG: hypothetical protein RR574_14040 [Comamonas sp.]